MEADKVPETAEAEQAMRRMIEQDHASVVVGASFGYFDPHMIKLAKEFPQVRFLHRSNLWPSEGWSEKTWGAEYPR